MIVLVTDGRDTYFFQVEGFSDGAGLNPDMARRIAFRRVHRRREKDYQEIMDQTQILQVQSISPDLATFLRQL